MDTAQEVIEAARQRSAALASGDATALRGLLHPQFQWLSHTGERFDVDSYVLARTGPSTEPVHQELAEVDVVVHPTTAVLRCQAVDPSGEARPMTQVWVRYDGRWACLAGHSGPRSGEPVQTGHRIR